MATDGKPASTSIISIDHLVLTVKSVEKTIEWYSKNLGMESQFFESVASPGIKRYSLNFGTQKINLHQLGKEFEPKAGNVKDGSADLCFITKDSVDEVAKRLTAAGVNMVDLGDEKHDNGVVTRTGAVGQLRSFYCRDPDDNLIEISNYI